MFKKKNKKRGRPAKAPEPEMEEDDEEDDSYYEDEEEDEDDEEIKVSKKNKKKTFIPEQGQKSEGKKVGESPENEELTEEKVKQILHSLSVRIARLEHHLRLDFY